MKKILNLGILLIVILISLQGVAQTSYKINPSTNKISSLNTILKFSKMYNYDNDFKEWEFLMTVDYRIAITLNADGTGKMVTAIGNLDKGTLIVKSCYEKIYSSGDKYWKFNCTALIDGTSKEVFIDIKDNAFYCIWYEDKTDNSQIVLKN